MTNLKFWLVENNRPLSCNFYMFPVMARNIMIYTKSPSKTMDYIIITTVWDLKQAHLRVLCCCWLYLYFPAEYCFLRVNQRLNHTYTHTYINELLLKIEMLRSKHWVNQFHVILFHFGPTVCSFLNLIIVVGSIQLTTILGPTTQEYLPFTTNS